MSARRLRDLALIAFLAVQLALPLRGLFTPRVESRSHFSWNMYSRAYRCEVGYQRMTTDGRIEMIDHRSLFTRPTRASMVFHRDVLGRFHASICERMRAQGGLRMLRGTVACTTDNEGMPVELILTNGDICSAERFGVGE